MLWEQSKPYRKAPACRLIRSIWFQVILTPRKLPMRLRHSAQVCAKQSMRQIILATSIQQTCSQRFRVVRTNCSGCSRRIYNQVTKMKATPDQNKELVLDAFNTLFNKRDYAAAEK